MKISLVTLVHNRKAALFNLIAGINSNSTLPDELVVIYMNEEQYYLPETLCPARQYSIASEHRLPLAAARNKAIESAQHEHVIFLDVDCIPGAELVAEYKQALISDKNALWAGRVRYLPKVAMNSKDLWHKMHTYSLPDPVRAEGEDFTYELFWSLNFACTKTTFNKIGGFDEAFTGYGAEDTDFAFSARKNDVAIKTITGIAYHQYHLSYSPPLNHLEDIVNNATRFKEKWGIWPMEGWLKKFMGAGHVLWTDDSLILTRKPTNEEIEAVLKDT